MKHRSQRSRRRRWAGPTGLAAAWACGVVGAAAPPALADPTPAERTEMVTAHNTVRTDAAPTPVPPLPAMAWSNSLETTAQAWASQCTFPGHSGTQGVGENLYASTGPTNPRPSPSTVVANWASEQAAYDYASNTCTPGQVCGHYTQIVTRTATQVGCGVQECDASTTPFTTPPFNTYGWHIWVCQYQTGQSAARPYLCDYDGDGSTTDICSDSIFADGFESGDTSAWSATVP